jgi:hypothetical protein
MGAPGRLSKACAYEDYISKRLLMEWGLKITDLMYDWIPSIVFKQVFASSYSWSGPDCSILSMKFGSVARKAEIIASTQIALDSMSSSMVGSFD